jgi:hypothetical protein
MPKLPYLSATLSAALVLLATQNAQSQPINYRVVQNTDNSPPLCYFQTSSGQNLDLTDMCGFISPAICREGSNKPELSAMLKDFCKKHEKCLLTSTCNEIPQRLNLPFNTGQPNLPADTGEPL